MLKTSFVIPTKNSGKTIEQCLSSLMPYYGQGYIQDIIVVDGLSTDDTAEKACRFPVKILRGSDKYKPPTYEIGWRNAAGDPIVFFDSDAYLGEGFLFKLFDFFQDEEVGVVGCEAHPVVSNNRVSVAVAQWGAYIRESLFSPRGLQRLHRWISIRNEFLPLPTGPCWVVRRSCIEAVNGFKGLPWNVAPDPALSQRIVNRGWKVSWWLNSPVYHYTRATLKSLLRQRAHNGVQQALLHREEEFKENAFHKVIYIAAHLATPLEGLMIALRWRNPIHIFLYPLAQYAFVIGYLVGLASGPEERIA